MDISNPSFVFTSRPLYIAGHVIEHFLGLPQNPLQAPDFGSWELKVVPLRRAGDGTLPKNNELDPYLAHTDDRPTSYSLNPQPPIIRKVQPPYCEHSLFECVTTTHECVSLLGISG